MDDNGSPPDPPTGGAPFQPPPAREGTGGTSDTSGPPPPARPTPVRKALELEAPPPPPEVPAPTRAFEDPAGRPWVARLVGRTRSGRPEDPGVDLALLVFEPADGGDAREALLPLDELDRLSDDEIVRALERSKASGSGADDERDFFADTRRPGQR